MRTPRTEVGTTQFNATLKTNENPLPLHAVESFEVRSDLRGLRRCMYKSCTPTSRALLPREPFAVHKLEVTISRIGTLLLIRRRHSSALSVGLKRDDDACFNVSNVKRIKARQDENWSSTRYNSSIHRVCYNFKLLFMCIYVVE